VTCNHHGVEPVEDCNARSIGLARPLCDSRDASTEFLDELIGTFVPTARSADPLDRAIEVRHGVDVDGQHFRVEGQIFDRLPDENAVDGTDVTDTLGQDEVGIERSESLPIDRVHTLTSVGISDRLVDVGAGSRVVDPQLVDGRQVSRYFWVIALVGDADGFDAEGETDLGRGWEERDDAHGCESTAPLKVVWLAACGHRFATHSKRKVGPHGVDETVFVGVLDRTDDRLVGDDHGSLAVAVDVDQVIGF